MSALAKEWNRLPDSAQFAVIGAAARLPRPTPDLVEIARGSVLGSSNERIRNASARVLGSSRDEKNIDLLGSYLRGAKSGRERSTALWALERIGSERAAEAVLQNLGSMPKTQRANVETKFERIRKKRAEMRIASERRK